MISSEDRRALSCVGISLGALLLSLVILPGSARIGGRELYSPSMRLFGILMAAVCAWAFLRCPRQHVALKFLTLVLLVPAVSLGVDCAWDYYFARLPQNQAVEYFLLCRRLHVC